MDSKLLTCILIIATKIINTLAYDKTISNQTMDLGYNEEDLKYEYECTPLDQWKLIKQHTDGAFIKDACMTNSYQIFRPPSLPILTNVVVVVTKTQILEIDERENSLTIALRLWSFWEDPRIKAKQFMYRKPIPLPPIYESHRYIWTPFTIPNIEYVKELTFVHNPILAKLALWPGDSVNIMYGISTNDWNGIVDPNTTMVAAEISWKIKISCDFDFSKYPFDSQNCPLNLEAEDINVTILRDTSDIRTNQDVFGGYDLKQGVFLRTSVDNLVFHTNYSTFGIYNNMTRQIGAFFYQSYLPSIAVVLTCFFSFLIPLTAIPGRVAILVTQFLTLTSIFIHAMSNSPSRSKMNRLGIYLLASLLFVFGAIVEFAIVLMAKQKADNTMSMSNVKQPGHNSKLRPKAKIIKVSEQTGISSDNQWKNGYITATRIVDQQTFCKNMPAYRKTDIIAFVLFNVVYVCFISVYFIVCFSY